MIARASCNKNIVIYQKFPITNGTFFLLLSTTKKNILTTANNELLTAINITSGAFLISEKRLLQSEDIKRLKTKIKILFLFRTARGNFVASEKRRRKVLTENVNMSSLRIFIAVTLWIYPMHRYRYKVWRKTLIIEDDDVMRHCLLQLFAALWMGKWKLFILARKKPCEFF